MNRLRRAVANPVLRRELLERWRGRRAFSVITIYVGLLAGLMRLLWWAGTTQLEDRLRWGGFEQIAAGPALGRFMFENLLALVLMLVLFIAPGYAAAQISGERERKTLGLLQITLVRPWQIVAGKLGASIAWLLLLIVVSSPIAATTFLLGGVTLPDLLRGYVMVLLLAVSIAGIGVGISALTRRTTAAIVLTYGTVLALVIGTLIASGVEALARRDQVNRGDFQPVALYANPYFGLADAARADRSQVFGSGFLDSILSLPAAALPQRRVAFAEPGVEVVGVGGFDDEPILRPVDGFGDRGFEFGVDGPREPVWLITLAIHLVLGAGGFAIATSRVRPENTPLLVRRGRRKDEEHDDEPARPTIEPLAAADTRAGSHPADLEPDDPSGRPT